MIKTTREQRVALKRYWLRIDKWKRPTYCAFRYTVQGYFAVPGPIVVPWCGMFIVIETDGYGHS